ncbi:hypothetical protein ES703_73684 [subsurface metagenome]
MDVNVISGYEHSLTITLPFVIFRVVIHKLYHLTFTVIHITSTEKHLTFTKEGLRNMEQFPTRLEKFEAKVELANPSPAVTFALLKELVSLLIEVVNDLKKDLKKVAPKPGD